jgi:hypothetical protein
MVNNNKKQLYISSHDIYIGLFICWLIIIVMFIVTLGPGRIVRGVRALRWHEQSCHVINNALSQNDSKNPVLMVNIQFEMEGKSYQSQCQLYESIDYLKQEAELFLRPGDEVKCRINLENPSEVMLTKEYDLFEFFFFFTLIMTPGFCIAAIIWSWWRRRKYSISHARIIIWGRKIAILFLCVFILVFCGIATLRGIGQSIQIFQSLRWLKTDAVIQNCSVTKIREGNSWDYKTKLLYAYTFEGKQYSCSQWSLFDDETVTNGKARKTIRNMKIGDKIICYVNPVRPEQAILDRQEQSFWGPPMLLWLLVFVGWLFWATLFEKEREKTESESEEDLWEIDLPELPFHLKYELNRRQRLIPHLKIWQMQGWFVTLILAAAPYILFIHWWLIIIPLGIVWFFKGYFVGLIDVLLCPMRKMDVIIDENNIGYLAGDVRRWIDMARILSVDMLYKEVWTLCHYSGIVIHIPVSVISEKQIRYIKKACGQTRNEYESDLLEEPDE